MSDVKRLPDADGWWWCKSMEMPVEVDAKAMMYRRGGSWWDCPGGQWLPCPAPEWPPEPPPRPHMVWASFCSGPLRWWVHEEDGKWIALGPDAQWVPSSAMLVPHDHPDQSAEESRRILEEVARANKSD